MTCADRRLTGRHFYLALAGLMLAVAGGPLAARPIPPVPQGGLTLTTVSGTVYRADGTPASGTLVITWPAFVTAGGAAVAGGTTNVALGANGALSVALVPNTGATPVGSYYVVVAQLGPAVAAREIIQPDQFKDGISKIIDGTVECLNASTWTKSSAQPSAVNRQPSVI